jgi:hypothetical protein
MTDKDSKTIELNIPLTLGDYLSLQFSCVQRLMVPFIVFFPAFYFACTLIPSLIAGTALIEAVSGLIDTSSIVILFCAIFFGLSIGFPITILQWYRGALPRELRASITGEELKIYGAKMNYSTHWSNVTSLTESDAAYMVKIKGPFVRLPKRGFTSYQSILFEELAKAGLSAGAYKLARV